LQPLTLCQLLKIFPRVTLHQSVEIKTAAGLWIDELRRHDVQGDDFGALFARQFQRMIERFFRAARKIQRHEKNISRHNASCFIRFNATQSILAGAASFANNPQARRESFRAHRTQPTRMRAGCR